MSLRPPRISQGLFVRAMKRTRGCAKYDGHVAMSIELEIEGVSDRAVTEAIRKRVRLLRHHPDPEDWRVRLVPSESEAEWDLGIRTASGWHVASFTAPAQRLADIVEQRLRAQLAVTAGDASAGGT